MQTDGYDTEEDTHIILENKNVELPSLINVESGFLFGIEIETCAYLISDTVKSNLENIITYLNNIGEIWDTYDVINVIDKKSVDYSKWNLVKDFSVNCELSVHSKCFKKDSTLKCPNLIFDVVEIVSPILKYEEKGFDTLRYVWEQIILSENLIYMLNTTQGFHIHISNDKLDIVKFVKIWICFEDLIFRLIPTTRIENSGYFEKIADKVHLLGKNFENILEIKINRFLKKTKYASINLLYFTEDSKRIEIRIFPSTMDINEILNYIMLCFLLASSSIILNDEQINYIYRLNNRDKETYFFDSILSTQNLSEYFRNLYQKS